MSEDKNIPTPRTDAWVWFTSDEQPVVSASNVRQLERELTASLSRVTALEAELKAHEHEARCWDEWLASVSEYEGDDAPWVTADNEFKSLEAKLAECWSALDVLMRRYDKDNIVDFADAATARYLLTFRNEPPVILTELSTLRRQVGEASKDTERLNMVEKLEASINRLSMSQFDRREFWHLYYTPPDKYNATHFNGEPGASLRHILDVALNQLATGKEGEK